MNPHEKLFLKLFQKCLKVTARGCFTGATSLAYICHCPLDHLLRNYACDIPNGSLSSKMVASNPYWTYILAYNQKKLFGLYGGQMILERQLITQP